MIGISPFIEAKEPPADLTDLRITAKASRSRPAQRPGALRVSYTLSTPANVELTVDRRVMSHRCEHGAATCEHWIRTAVKLKLSGHAGANSVVLSIARLAAGTYRLDATPVGPSSALGTTRYLHFTTAG